MLKVLFIFLTVLICSGDTSSSNSGSGDSAKCKFLSKLCEDKYMGKTVRMMCGKRCGLSKPVCKDSSLCPSFLNKHICSSKSFSIDTKAKYCRKTCNLCNHTIAGSSQTAPTEIRPVRPQKVPKPITTYESFLESIDPTVKPCDNFYLFACGNYEKKYKNSDTVHTMIIDVNRELANKQEELIFGNEPSNSHAVAKMRIYRKKCLETPQIEQLKTTHLREHIEKMGSCPFLSGSQWNSNLFDFTSAVIHILNTTAFSPFFTVDPHHLIKGSRVWISPQHLIINNPDNYFNDGNDNKLQATSKFLHHLIELVMTDAGLTVNHEAIVPQVLNMIKFERAMASILVNDARKQGSSRSNFALKNYIELRTDYPVMNWRTYFSNHPLLPSKFVNELHDGKMFSIHQPAALAKLSKLISDTSAEVLANYMVLRLIILQAPVLDSRFIKVDNEFAKQLDGIDRDSSRGQNCLKHLMTHFPLVSDHLYVNKYFPSEKREYGRKFIEGIQKAMKQVIDKQSWLDSETKKRAGKKLNATKFYIGGIDEIYNIKMLDAMYNGIELNTAETFAEITNKLQLFRKRKLMEDMMNPDSKTYSKSILKLRATTANAHMFYEYNSIFVPAALLQPPMMEYDLAFAISYGRAGSYIGHEFGHLFDSKGINYDDKGEYLDWWTPHSKSTFTKSESCFVNQYDNVIEPKTGNKVNGHLTINENIADNTGVHIAYIAYMNYIKKTGDSAVPGFQKYNYKQIFFMSYATSYCSARPAHSIDHMMKVDSHAPNYARVNTVLSNNADFHSAFGCVKGTPMNRKAMCTIW